MRWTVLVSCAVALVVSAANVTVECPSGSCSFDVIVGAASTLHDGDTLVLPPATFTGPCTTAGIVLAQVSVIGYYAETTIDCRGQGRPFSFQSSNIFLTGLIIANTNGTYSAVWAPAATLTVTDCVFENCSTTTTGGAITTNVLVVVNSDFNFNSGPTGGGAIVAGGQTTLNGSRFYMNSAPNNAGGAFFGGPAAVIDCEFTSNRAGTSAGAIYASPSLLIIRSTFTGNSAETTGGATQSNVVAIDSTFIANSAGEGGVQWGGTQTTFVNCTFIGNAGNHGVGTGLGGGVVFGNCVNSTRSYYQGNYALQQAGVFLLIYNVCPSYSTSDTFVGNYAPNGPGGVFQTSSSVYVNDSVFIGKYADSGGAIMLVDSAVGVVTNSVFKDNSAPGNGGVIVVTNAQPLSISGCTFDGNLGANGAAIAYNNVSVVSSHFVGNSADGNGGALYGGNAEISNSTFTANTAFSGSAIYTNVMLTVLGTTFAANSAGGHGGSGRGAVYLTPAACQSMQSTFTDVSFTANTAVNGAGLYVDIDSCTITLSNVDFAENNASESASALVLSSGVLILNANVRLDVSLATTTLVCESGTIQLGTSSPPTILVPDGQLAGGLEAFQCPTSCGCCNAPSTVTAPECLLLPYVPCYNFSCGPGFAPKVSTFECVTQPSTYSPLEESLCLAVGCNPPTNLPPHVIYEGSCIAQNGGLCELTCEPGYEMVGLGIWVCQPDGQFAGQNVSCENTTVPGSPPPMAPPTAPPPSPPQTPVSPSVSPPPLTASNAMPRLTLYLLIGGGALIFCMGVIIVTCAVRRRPAKSTTDTAREMQDPLLAGQTVADYTVSRTKAAMSVVAPRAGPMRFAIDTGSVKQVDWEELKIVRELGKGGFGVVYHVRHQTTMTDMALKILNHVTSVDQLIFFLREVAVHANLHHPHCLSFIGIVLHDSDVGILSELMSRDLESVVETASAEQKMGALAGATRGLAYLHSVGITHADLKPSNVLLDDRGKAVLADFGLSGIKASKGYTERYAAPEVVAGQTPDARSDMFSLGCLICRVLLLQVPFVGLQPGAPRPELPYTSADLVGIDDDELRGLLLRCFAKDPAARPTVTDVVRALSRLSPL